jgi:hypothetical protein
MRSMEAVTRAVTNEHSLARQARALAKSSQSENEIDETISGAASDL